MCLCMAQGQSKQVVLRFLTSQDQIPENPHQGINTNGVPGKMILLTTWNPTLLDSIYLVIGDTLQTETLPFSQSPETIKTTLILKVSYDVLR